MKNNYDITAEQQKQHRQERNAALQKRQHKKAYASLCRHICAAVFDAFPELCTNDALSSGKLSDELVAQVEDIKLVLCYCATHPRFLANLKSDGFFGSQSATHKCAVFERR